MFTIDLSNIEIKEEKKEFEVIPEGLYTFAITDAEVRDSKAGNKYVWLELTCKDAKFEKRKVWDFFTLSHDVGLQRLATLATFCEVDLKKFDPAFLIGHDVSVLLGVEHDDNYGDKNRVRKYSSAKFKKSSDMKIKEKAASDEELPF
jgi:hypothetical protein